MNSNDTSETDSTSSSTEETPENVRRSNRIKLKVLKKNKNKHTKPSNAENDSVQTRKNGNEDEIDKVETKQNTKLKRPSRVVKKVSNPAEKFYDKYHEQFYFKLSNTEKQIIATQENEIYINSFGHVPIRFRILQSKMESSTKSSVLDKIAPLLKENGLCSEIPKLQKWVDTVLRIPFGVLRHPPVTNKSGIEEIRNHINKIENRLDEHIYGHSETKKQIVRLIAKWISNPSSRGNVIGIYGPPGVGKSSLVKQIGESLETPTITIPLGGACDSSFLEGHSYVYEGSMPGILVSSVTKAGCMNPVIMFDELDKISESSKGSDITNVLIHLTDPVQNDNFRDKYLGDVGIDLSHAIFVFTFNDIESVHPVLLDRMTNIETKPYNITDKYTIATKHLLPKICKDHGLQENKIYINETVFREIVSTIECESGVRNLGRALEAIVSRVTFDLLVGKNSKFGETGIVNLTDEMVKEVVKPKQVSASVAHMYL
jgi:ATP-dependent Lon protease